MLGNLTAIWVMSETVREKSCQGKLFIAVFTFGAMWVFSTLTRALYHLFIKDFAAD